MNPKNTSPWKTLYVYREDRPVQQIDLSVHKIQLRATATSFDLWVMVPDDEDAPYVAELRLLGAQFRDVSESDLTYEGFLDESLTVYGNKDNSRTVRQATIILSRD